MSLDARAAAATVAYLEERAEQARADADAHSASILYAEAARLSPPDAKLETAAGEAFADAGAYHQALDHLRRAAELTGNAPDALLRLGHCHRRFGRLQEAEDAYGAAGTFEPAVAALAQLHASGWRGRTALRKLATEAEGRTATPAESTLPSLAQAIADRANPLIVEELLPEAPPAPPSEQHGKIEVLMAGRRERTPWGEARTLRGVEALRGRCYSHAALEEVRVRLDGETVLRTKPRGPYASSAGNAAKFVFNLWMDFSRFAPGRYEIEIMLGDLRGEAHVWRDIAVVAEAIEAPASDGWVQGGYESDEALVTAVVAAPTMIRRAKRRFGLSVVREILVLRLDQLGDLVLSVPAIRRLRSLFPHAKLTGLVTPANSDFARVQGLFDEIVEINFPDCPEGGGRRMTREAQMTLTSALRDRRFDVAIDLCEGAASRPLLQLADADVRFGFGMREFPWLDAEVQGFTHDARNRNETASHGAKVGALVEWLGAITSPPPPPERRRDLSGDLAVRYGIRGDREVVVLHTGARLPFTRWPHFEALAQRLAGRGDVHTVLLGAPPPDLGRELPTSPLLTRAYGQIAFDDFDALLHRCRVFVGNDSGPKHLAALRGADVVSLHMARNNWNEWGQEGRGVILSRRVPCAGCLIQRDPEDCGRDLMCLSGISPADVYEAVTRYL